MADEKRQVHVKLAVVMCTAQTSWDDAALIFQDQTGDLAPRKVTLRIERPSDISYIRERLQDIENAWRRELDTLRAGT